MNEATLGQMFDVDVHWHTQAVQQALANQLWQNYLETA